VAETQPILDAVARAALAQLADVTAPPQVSWMPQTWGWALLAALVLAGVIWSVVRWRRQRAANRYRIEALAALARLEVALSDPASRGEALAAIPPLIKRTALAVWPRSDVASLSGDAWLAFLGRHHAGDAPPGIAGRLLADAEYRSTASLAAMPIEDARACVRTARLWIERHRVSA
jgi:hypothetical protein